MMVFDGRSSIMHDVAAAALAKVRTRGSRAVRAQDDYLSGGLQWVPWAAIPAPAI